VTMRTLRQTSENALASFDTPLVISSQVAPKKKREMFSRNKSGSMFTGQFSSTGIEDSHLVLVDGNSSTLEMAAPSGAHCLFIWGVWNCNSAQCSNHDDKSITL
jgi:hypothetical protein